MIAIIGTSDRPCWLAEACKIFLLLQRSWTVIADIFIPPWSFVDFDDVIQ